MTVARESNPTKRAELHAARALIGVAEKALAEVNAMSQRGGLSSVTSRVASARDSLHYAERDLSAALKTYDPAVDPPPHV